MIPALMFQKMQSDGVALSLDGDGRLKVNGTQEAVTIWRPVLQSRRGDFVRLLAVQDFIEDIEERAAIMEYDAPDCHPTREAATAAAYADVLKNNQNLSNEEEMP